MCMWQRSNCHPLCPVHAASRHLARARRCSLSSPVVPTAAGDTCQKTQIVSAFESVLATVGVATSAINHEGKSVARFGGHMARVAGAQFLAAQGVPLPTVQLLEAPRVLKLRRGLATLPFAAMFSMRMILLWAIFATTWADPPAKSKACLTM